MQFVPRYDSNMATSRKFSQRWNPKYECVDLCATYLSPSYSLSKEPVLESGAQHVYCKYDAIMLFRSIDSLPESQGKKDKCRSLIINCSNFAILHYFTFPVLHTQERALGFSIGMDQFSPPPP